MSDVAIRPGVGGGARLSVRADLLDPTELAAGVGADLQNGLDPDVVDDRLRRWGPNEIAQARGEPLLLRVARHVLEPMSLLLLVASGVSGFALGERLDAIAIAAIVVMNVAIAVLQEDRAEHALRALERMTTSVATVIRGGRTADIPARELVVGDLVVLRQGDRVPADSRLVDATSLETDESVLTGESLPVAKSASAVPDEDAGVADRRAMVFDGSLVTRGTGRAFVVATGMGSEIGAIAGRIGERVQPTPLQRQLRSVALRIGIATVAIAVTVAALLVARGGARADVVQHAFLVAVALAVAAVPEGLAAVTTVTLALGTRRMAARGGIVRHLPAVETLGATTVLAIDKTGTLTENRLQVEAFVVPTGGPGASLVQTSSAPEALAEIAVLCNDASLHPPSGDPLEVALLRAVPAERVDAIRRSAVPLASIPFDAERKRMTTVHRTSGGLVVATKGAPETILELCTDALTSDGERTSLDKAAVAQAAASLAEDGFRVLALARRELLDFAGDVLDAERALTLAGLVGLDDPMRTEAPDAVRSAREAGVQVVMVTGDHPVTARTIARRVGLAEEPVDVRTGADLRTSGLPDDPLSVPVYARVDPDQKLQIVERLQQLGHVVAVTGDGVNDAPALHRADIGVALGASGTEVAREAADLVITDDDLATIVSAIREGRGIYANIRKVVDYLLACNLSEVITVFAAIVLFPGIGVPLLPLQLLWMNLITDGLPALALGVDPTDPAVMQEPPRRRDERLLGGAQLVTLTMRGAVLALVSIAVLVVVRYVMDDPWPSARTVMFTTLVWTQLLHVFSARRLGLPLRARISPVGLLRSIVANRRLAAAAVLGALLQSMIVVWRPAGRVFGTVPFSAEQWLVVFVGAALAALLVAALPQISPRSRGRGKRLA